LGHNSIIKNGKPPGSIACIKKIAWVLLKMLHSYHGVKLNTGPKTESDGEK